MISHDLTCSHVIEQVRVLSTASVIIGLHGAGLSNVLFAREGALMIELKGAYGINDYVYRKYTQAIYGGWATIHVDERASGEHVVSPTQAAAVGACLLALRADDVARCRELPHVIQASSVGHDWDCWFREWIPTGRPASDSVLCPTPSWWHPIWLQIPAPPPSPKPPPPPLPNLEPLHPALRLMPPHPPPSPMPPPPPPPSPPPPTFATCWHAHYHARLTPLATDPTNCTGLYASEAEALGACHRDARCDGVTRPAFRESAIARWRCFLQGRQGGANAQGRQGGTAAVYSLRRLPLHEYRGEPSGELSFVKLRASTPPWRACLQGMARLERVATKPPVRVDHRSPSTSTAPSLPPPADGAGRLKRGPRRENRWRADREALREQYERESRLADIAAGAVPLSSI